MLSARYPGVEPLTMHHALMTVLGPGTGTRGKGTGGGGGCWEGVGGKEEKMAVAGKKNRAGSAGSGPGARRQDHKKWGEVGPTRKHTPCKRPRTIDMVGHESRSPLVSPLLSKRRGSGGTSSASIPGDTSPVVRISE